MTGFKNFCKDFPTQGGSVVVALVLIFFTGVAVIGRLASGADFPDGYDGWLLFLGALATGTWAAMIGKRLSDFRYKEAGATTTTTTTEMPVPVPGAAIAATTTTTITPSLPVAPVPPQPPPIAPAGRDD